MLDASLRTSIEKFFRIWTNAFDSFDSEAIADLMNVPLTIIGRDGAIALTTRDEIVRNFDLVNDHHKSLGYHRAELSSLDLFATHGPNLVRAETKWSFRRKDNSLIYWFRMHYILADYGNGWRAVVAVNADDAHEV